MPRFRFLRREELWQPADYETADVHAVQALARGEASPEQQVRALEWIVNMAGTYDQPFHEDSPRKTDFALGMRSVGLQIMKLLNVKPGRIENADKRTS